MILNIHPKKVLQVLVVIFLILLVFHCGAVLIRFKLDFAFSSVLLRLFHFDFEGNVPSYYSALILLMAAGLLAMIGHFHRKQTAPYFYWFGLALIFLFLSVDEVSVIHETLVDPMKKLFNTSGFLLFAWVIPYGLASVVLAIVYLKFILRPPKDTLVLFLIAGGTFIEGVYGMEMFSAKYTEVTGQYGSIYDLLTTIEESLEILGVTIFIYALLSYMASQFGSCGLVITDQEEVEAK